MENPKGVQNAGVLCILTCKCASRPSGVSFFDNCSTSALQKAAGDPHVFKILTCKCASRYSCVHFWCRPTSKSAPPLRCFAHFDLQMCFAAQRRAIFRHLNFQKWAKTVSFLAFWLANVLRATAACHFSTSQVPKVVRALAILYILTCKCASRHSGVPLFHIPTSKSAPKARCFKHFYFKRASRHSGVSFSLSALSSHLRTRRFSEPTFRPSRHTNPRKKTAFRDFPHISLRCMFFLLSLFLFSAFHLLTLLLCSAFSTVHIVGS